VSACARLSTTVRAPIDGVAGAVLVSEGALVRKHQRNLATIQSWIRSIRALQPVRKDSVVRLVYQIVGSGVNHGCEAEDMPCG
jgi:hypothetical protein